MPILIRRLNDLRRRLQSVGVVRVRPEIVRTLPHDPAAYTQGLIYASGELYESTGLAHASSLRRIDPGDGHVLEQVPVAGDFAEGIALLGERIYQLTWQSGRVLVYDRNPLRRIAEHRIEHEGWGLASDGGQLWISDGTAVLRRYSPAMVFNGALRAHAAGLAFRHLNAIVMARGRLYANVWCTPLVAEIDPADGHVLRLVDCSELVRAEASRNPHSILNGIAFNADSCNFFMTGKCWRLLFEVRIPAR